MRPCALAMASILISVSCGLFPPQGFQAWASAIPEISGADAGEFPFNAPRDLQLEVFINGTSTELIASFRQSPDGTLSVVSNELRSVGIEPAGAEADQNGWISVRDIPGVSYEFDEAAQAIRFSVPFSARSTRIIDAQTASPERSSKEEASSDFGGLVNYTLFASTGGSGFSDLGGFEGASGWFEGRVFGHFGTLTSSHIANTSSGGRYGSTRLDTTWSYSQPGWLTTFRAGDLITGGLSWSRPTRLGGLQIQRNFGLRPDLVTMPLPDLSGSAAVPSTVDVYVNNARRFSQDVQTGPFQITNLPVVTGAGTARVVVRDALGRETISETPFFASSNLLAAGLWDYSAEVGFARRFYGVESFDYDERLMASATLRRGISDGLTLEGHAEGGDGLINGGGGAVFGLGPYGVGSLAASASTYGGQAGFQFAASADLELHGLHFFARTQRTFGDYNDIAGVTASWSSPLLPGDGLISAAPPRAIDQIAVSVPLKFDPARFNLSLTQLETIGGDKSQILGASLYRPVDKGSVYVTAFADLKNRGSSGVFMGISVPLGPDIYSATGVSSDSSGTFVTTDIIKSERAEIGSVGWRIRDTEGARTNRAASISYRAGAARLQADVEQYDDLFRSSLQADGAIVFAGRDVFLSNRINDAFTVVDAGAPDVAVQYENRPVGRTNSRGKLLLPDLRSYEQNQVSIDPTNLPVDATVSGTRAVTVPAERGGTVVKFDVRTDAQGALVTLRDEDGAFVETGATGLVDGSEQEFVVGYDGQAYITGLAPQSRLTIDQPNRKGCVAEFAFSPDTGNQVKIPDVICRSVQ